MQALFVYTRRSSVHHFPFISDEHIILSNKVKQVCYKIISINSLFIIYYDFSKIFNIEKVWTPWEKLRVKAATFLTGLPLCVLVHQHNLLLALPCTHLVIMVYLIFCAGTRGVTRADKFRRFNHSFNTIRTQKKVF